MALQKRHTEWLLAAAVGAGIMAVVAGVGLWVVKPRIDHAPAATPAQVAQQNPATLPTPPVAEGPALPAQTIHYGEEPDDSSMTPAQLADAGVPVDTSATLAPPPTPLYITHGHAADPTIPPGAPRIIIDLDDLGVAVEDSAQAIREMPAAVSFAFLPYGKGTPTQIKEAYAAGHEVLVHLPMQPIAHPNRKAPNPGPNALFTNLSPDEIVRRANINIDPLLPYVVGVNNHMGSAFTQDEAGMRLVLQQVAKDHLFFMDSLTIATSKVPEAAKGISLPLITRDVFLDDTITTKAIEHQLKVTEEVARQKGTVVVIGHPHPKTLAALVKWIPTLKAKGLYLVPITDIIRHPTHPGQRVNM